MGTQNVLNRAWVRWARGIFAIVVVGLLSWLLITEGSEIAWADGLWVRIMAASLLGVGGLLAAAAGWGALIGTEIGPAIATMGIALPIRHLPMGGFGQLIGMSGLAKATKAGRASLTHSTPLFLASTAGGASLVALPTVWDPVTPSWLRLLVAVAALGTCITVWRGDRVLRSVLRRLGRSPSGDSTSLVGPVVWSTVAALATSLAFLVLFPQSTSLILAVARFAAAWLCGFLFVIAPAGLGVREGVLVLLWPELEPATVVAVGVLHRFSSLAAETLVFALAWRFSRGLGDGGSASAGKPQAPGLGEG